MAPVNVAADASSAPLADYFFIAGIESSRIFEGRNRRSNGFSTSSPRLDPTLEEHGAQEEHLNMRPSSPKDSPGSSDGNTRRPARYSFEARKSISSVIGLDNRIPASNRSSATIRPLHHEAKGNADGLEEDFELALRKFAAERDSVIDEISFAAGQSVQPGRPAPRPKPKTQRITSGEDSWGDKGGIRRRISTMNPLSRSNTASRRSSIRNSKRMSGYNSVIPSPQRFLRDENMHPLKRPYEPALLDQYPSRDALADEPKRRLPFPDYVPMFVFPNDINVVSSDFRPRSTWHGFAMTNGDGSKLHGICLIIWIPLADDAAEDLELQCEEWRKRNMTGEERELANSLGERLALERTRLSELLNELREGNFASAEEYESKQDQLSATEEKIQLMTDMLKPVRHGAASKIEGLTDGDSGLWIPRAYGILGRDVGLTSFWKEWLRAITVPMMHGAILRVPPSSPRVGTWAPLERYVVNLCAEALSPTTSITQVELSIRELRLYARKEAVNEIPGSRNTDLYALFRSLQIPDIIVLFEYVLSESRVILLSSHTSMLHLACQAIVQLLYPLRWAGVFIPVLPARLIQALEAPCPYIVGIERRYESVELPEDDFVLVDLDQGIIEATQPPVSLPRQIRRKLNSLLQLAAPHHYRCGVPTGPPIYATDAYPHNTFPTENPSVFDASATPSNLAYLANLNSSSFGSAARSTSNRLPLFNAFRQARRNSSNSFDRPSTASTAKTDVSPPSPVSSSGTSHFPPSITRTDSNALQASLREKRSGVFDPPKRNSSFGFDRLSGRRPSAPMHAASPSISTLGTEPPPSSYAPSVYAQSTLAASTIMPHVLMQPVHNTETTQWCEGHCMQWRQREDRVNCAICDDRVDDGVFRCSGCGICAHNRCLSQLSIVCPSAFHQDQVIAAFVRCFASLFYTYRKFMTPTSLPQRKTGQHYKFNMDAFIKSVPHDTADYITMLRDTQAFNEFIHERQERSANEPSVRLFDEIILSKRNRGRTSIFSKNQISFLADSSDHLWRTAAANTPAGRREAGAAQHAVGRAPAQLDPSLLKEPRVVQGVPRVTAAKARRKPVPSMLGPIGPDFGE